MNETVPISFIKSADEIEIVDAPPEQPLERSAEEQAAAEKREQRLSKLRELAMVLAADIVEHQLSTYLERRGIRHYFGTQERILVCVTPRANVREMIEIACTVAERFHAELVVACVKQPGLSPADDAALEEKLEMAQAVGAEIQILEGEDPVDTILEFAKSRGITQLFIGHTRRSGVWSNLWGAPVDKLIRRPRGMDVRVFPQ